jgi:hypothetical protein
MSENWSVLNKAAHAEKHLDPFPYAVIKNALRDDVFEALSGSYPRIETIAGPGPLQNNTLYLRSAREVVDDPGYPQQWRAFFAYHCARAFYLEVLNFWRDELSCTHPRIALTHGKSLDEFTCGMRRLGERDNPENKAQDIQLDCQFGVNSPVEQVTSVRGPHVDTRYKLFAAILYFRADGDDSTGGDLEFYRYRDPALGFRPGEPVDADFVENSPAHALNRIETEYVEKVKTLTYEPNTLVMWLNTPQSIHGVSPRACTAWPRRYVNILGESYVGKRDGFFATKRKRGLRRLLARA